MRRVFLVSLIVVTLLAIFVVEGFRHAGAFRKIAPHFAGTCQAVPLPGSAEDIQIDRAGRLAYLSVLDRRAVFDGKDVSGTILKVDLNARRLGAVPALANAPADFRPHGLSLYIAPDGSQRLFVISRAPGKPPTVEIFERGAAGRFAHLETLHNPLLLDPDAIVAVGPRQFYVANLFGAPPGFQRVAEVLFRRAIADIVYYDGDAMRVVGDALALGAGIAATADGGRVYVSEANAHRLRVYSRDSATGDLELFQNVRIPSAGDNLNVAEDGAIWVTAHPNALKLVRHLRDPRERAPTQILRIAADPQAPDRIGEVYMNDGTEISAGSVAAVLGKRMLIGSLTEHKILDCSLPWTFR